MFSAVSGGRFLQEYGGVPVLGGYAFVRPDFLHASAGQGQAAASCCLPQCSLDPSGGAYNGTGRKHCIIVLFDMSTPNFAAKFLRICTADNRCAQS